MNRIRARIFELLEGQGDRDPRARACDYFLIALILANALAAVLVTDRSLAAAYGPWFDLFEVLSVAVFTAEYALRIWSAPERPHTSPLSPARARLRYIRSPLAVVDLLAILPFYLGAFLPYDLRLLRLFRVLRVLKLMRYSPTLGTLAAVIHNERRTVFGSLCVLAVIILLSSAALYHLEHDAQPDAFGNMGRAMWWAVATLTTVGYGDVIPQTVPGRIVGSIVMLLGVGIFVLWTSVFASGFIEEMRKRRFVVTWKLVAQVPIFSRLDAERIAEIAAILIPEVVPQRHTVIRRGEAGNCMYFIVSGEVEMDLPHTVVRLGRGQFFGELSLLQRRERLATVTTLTECQLLRLDNDDFERLIDNEPELKDEITRLAEDRAGP